MTLHSSGRFAWLALAAAAGLGACAQPDATLAPRLTPDAPRLAVASGAPVVISQVYGAGGNANALFKNDYVELYNPGTTSVPVDGWSVQYASATGTGNFGANAVTVLTGSIPAGGYYLVKLAGGTTGADLPVADATGTVNMSGTAGKVALVDQSGGLACNGSSTACTADQLSHIVDLVGFGSANFFEGTGPAPAPAVDKADFRRDVPGGKQDTNDNAADFVLGAPAPRNTGTNPGGGTTVGPFDHVVITGASTVNANGTTVLTAGLQDASNQAITDANATYAWQSSDPATVQILSTSANTATIKGLVSGGPVTITVTATSSGLTKATTKSVTVPQPTLGHVTINAGTNPLVIGYQTQLFVNSGSTDQSGNPVGSADVTWSTSNPAIVTVDARGVITAAGDGSAVLTGTAADGSAGSVTVTTEVPIYSSTARTGHNTEFGVPSDADPSNDVIIARKQYTISYNPQKGGPNWVSWDLSATHLGTRNRCNCYSADTALARLGYGAFMYTTADYTGGGYDRGHMEPSADQTTTDGENATTFFLTNFLPQAHGLNAGPWEALENDLRDSVNAGREAYVIAGGIFTNGVGLGSLKNEGKIFIPDSTWKIIVLMPANTGLANVASASDVNVIAVNMPNVDAPGTNDWRAFRTTVAKIQRSTGYDFLAALPDNIESAVEGGASGVPTYEMDVQPGQISVSSTAVANVVLLSTATFDASAVNAANVRLVVNGGAQVAPIMRGTTVNTSVADFNGDGRPDRLIGFSVAALRAAGFAPGAASIVLQLAGATPPWQAYDANPPIVVP